MPSADFTIRLVDKCPHREATQIWRAAMIVTGMEGCAIEEIVQALSAFEATRDVGVQDPARWLTHFAGLESMASGKARSPWIEITHQGTPLSSREQFRQLLLDRTRPDT